MCKVNTSYSELEFYLPFLFFLHRPKKKEVKVKLYSWGFNFRASYQNRSNSISRSTNISDERDETISWLCCMSTLNRRVREKASVVRRSPLSTLSSGGNLLIILTNFFVFRFFLAHEKKFLENVGKKMKNWKMACRMPASLNLLIEQTVRQHCCNRFSFNTTVFYFASRYQRTPNGFVPISQANFTSSSALSLSAIAILLLLHSFSHQSACLFVYFCHNAYQPSWSAACLLTCF